MEESHSQVFFAITDRRDIGLYDGPMLMSLLGLGIGMIVKFLCAILLRMGCGRSLSVLRILPTGMCFLPAW